MARLPNPGQDDGTWGGILNDYLSQSHQADGTLKDSIITNAKLDASTKATLTSVAGKIDTTKIGVANGVASLGATSKIPVAQIPGGIPAASISGIAVITTDSRLANARTPTAHKATHAIGGTDVLTPVDIGAVATVNGVAPDGSGNVVVSGGGAGLTPDPDHSGYYLISDSSALTPDPDHSGYYLIGASA